MLLLLSSGKGPNYCTVIVVVVAVVAIAIVIVIALAIVIAIANDIANVFVIVIAVWKFRDNQKKLKK